MGRASLLAEGQFGLRGVGDLPSTWVLVSQQGYLPMLSPHALSHAPNLFKKVGSFGSSFPYTISLLP